jgi:hypothetical protein
VSRGRRFAVVVCLVTGCVLASFSESTVSTRRSSIGGWLLAPLESARTVEHRARLRRWVHCGERFDYAWVDVDPVLDPTETGISTTLDRVLLAPRHEGVYLDEPRDDWPIHVYLLTTPEELVDSEEVPADAVRIRAWALLTRTI